MDPSSNRLARQQQLAEMLSHFRPLDPLASPTIEPAILAPLLREGDFLSVSGEAGCGKTTLAADLLLGYSHSDRNGVTLGGLFQFNPVYNCSGNVAIIDAENAPPRWQSLLLRKMKAEGLDPLKLRGTIEYVRPADIGLYKEKDWATKSSLLAEALSEKGVLFAVIDSLGRTWSPSDINSTAWVQQGVAPFRSTCQSLGITIVALTHVRRSSGRDDNEAVGPLGSSLQEAQADAQVMMTINKDGRGCRLKLRKSRRAFWIPPGTSVSLDFTTQFGYQPHDGWETLWPHEYSDDPSGPAGDAGMKAQILTHLGNTPDASIPAATIAQALGCTAHTITNHLDVLETAGQVVREGRGPVTRWRLSP